VYGGTAVCAVGAGGGPVDIVSRMRLGTESEGGPDTVVLAVAGSDKISDEAVAENPVLWTTPKTVGSPLANQKLLVEQQSLLVSFGQHQFPFPQ
jgi:hypothetical protein